MSKKKRYKHLRSMIVNAKDYKWLVEKVDEGNLLKIWDKDKNLIHQEIMAGYLSIYPKDVKEIIESK